MCTKGIRPHFLSDAYFLSASLRAVRDTPKKTSLTSRAPTTRTHEPTPLCSSPPPDRPRAYLIASHDHNAGYASLRARPHASPSFHARSRSRNGPLTAAPRPFLTRPPRPTRMSGVRQDTLNATRSSNFVRFMLAYVLPALVSRLLSRACFRPRLRPRGRDDLSQNSYPQTHSCAFCSSAFSPAARPETHPFPQTLTPYPYPHPYPVPPTQWHAAQNSVQAGHLPWRFFPTQRPVQRRGGAKFERRPERAAVVGPGTCCISQIPPPCLPPLLECTTAVTLLALWQLQPSQVHCFT